MGWRREADAELMRELSLALAVWVTVCAGPQTRPVMAEVVFSPADCAMPARPSSPNHWLAAGLRKCEAIADEPVPVFEASVTAVSKAWRTWVDERSRAALISVSADGRQIHVTDKTVVFGFIDDIWITLTPLDEACTSVVVYALPYIVQAGSVIGTSAPTRSGCESDSPM